MSILIKKAGLLDSFQDLGRTGFRQNGINPTGAMDKTAVRLINILLGNDENDAVLEMHFPAPKIEFKSDAIFALGGANFSAQLNNQAVKNWQIQTAQAGDTLTFDKKIIGTRCYLAIEGGFEIDKWLGSSSTNLTAEIGGFKGRKLEAGDEIKFNQSKIDFDNLKHFQIARTIIPNYSKSPTVRIIEGSDYRDLTALSEQVLLSNNFKISGDSNRMGFRLEGKSLYLLNDQELVSSAVQFGTIQLLPEGQMIILMADHQTAGGYPKIAHIIEKDLPIVAQLGALDTLGFHLISHSEAEELKINMEKDLSFLKMGVRLTSK